MWVLPGRGIRADAEDSGLESHHGVGTDGVYYLSRFVTWIVRSGAHVISLNEVEKNNG